MRILFPLMVLSILIISTGFFSTSMNSVYSQTTTEEKKVELLTSKIREGEYSTKFIGQVQNMLTENVEFVKIIATFYDQNADMIGSKSTYAKPSDLQPNMKAPFEMYLDDDIRDQVHSYDVTITWQKLEDTEEFSNVYESSPQSELKTEN